MDVKDQVKRSLSILEVVSLYVGLQPAGKYYKGLCPFHKEKTPSFYVSPEKGSYNCYGCNRFGDIFSFIQEQEGLTFPEAINFLVDRFSLQVDRSEPRFSGNKSDNEDYYRINSLTIDYYKNLLYESSEGAKARDYLKKRGFSQNTVDKFQMGYALNGWNGLRDHLGSKGVNLSKAEQLGLLVKGNNGLYDRFRGRIMVPIISESGRVIAFGGRTIWDDQNKYLNSPDTPIYKKSKHLFGFNVAKGHIRENKSVILVEGYFDMISLYQHGVENCVASLGTALTDLQIYLLKRFTDDIKIFYDSDSAGIKAMARGVEKMFELAVVPEILQLKSHKDPDDFIRDKGLEGFGKLVKSARNGYKFLLEQAVAGLDLRVPVQKKKAAEKVVEILEKLDDNILKNEYKQIAASFLDINEDLLILKSSNDTSVPKSEKFMISPAERDLLEVMLSVPALIPQLKEAFLTDELLGILKSGNILKALMCNYDQRVGDFTDIGGIRDSLSPSEQGLLRELFSNTESLDEGEIETRLEASFGAFHEKLRKEKIEKINRELKVAEKDKDFERVKKLMEKKMNLVKLKFKSVQEA